MSRRIIITCLLFCLSFSVKSQAIIWTDTITALNNQHGRETFVDAAGNTYVVGEFESTITLNTISGPVIVTSDGNYDGLLLKYNPTGLVVWYAKIGGTSGGLKDEIIYDVAVDASGNVYVCGQVETGTTTFYGNGNPDILRSNSGSTDCFFAGYNVNGDLLWAVTPSSVNFDLATGITTDGTNVYITGYFHNNIDFGSGASSILPNIGGSGADGFIASYSTAGVFNWVRRIEGTSDDIPTAIAQNGNYLYATGYSGNNNITFTGSPNVVLTNIDGDDIWTAKFDKSNGDVSWAVIAGGNGDDEGTDLVTDASGVYVSGFFANSLAIYSPAGTFVDTRTTNGGEDVCIIYYDFNGVKQNVITRGGINNDEALAIAVDGNGDLFIGGTFTGSIDFGSGTITSAGGTDCFLSKFQTNGTHIQTRHISGIGNNVLSGVDLMERVALLPVIIPEEA